MRPTKTHMKPKKHGWGFKTPKVEDIKEILSDAANDGGNPSSMQKLLPPFTAAEERRLAEKLTGRDPNPLSPLERKFIAAALGVVAEQKDMFKSISNTDELTGLLNRRGSGEVIEREFARRDSGRKGLQRFPNAEVAVVNIDLDFFKQINDVFGHAVGDKALQKFAQAIKGALRKTDALARIGGDEFFAILPYDRDKGAPTYQILRDRIDTALKGEVFWKNDQPFPLSASIGIATTQDDLSDIEAENIVAAMEALADERLYEDKKTRIDRIKRLKQVALGAGLADAPAVEL